MGSIKKLYFVLPLLFFSVSPFLSRAENSNSKSTLEDYEDVISLIEKVANWMYGILLALAVVFILMAAYNFMFSGGSEQSVSKAKSQLLYTLIAIVIASISRGIISLLETLLTNTTNTT